MSAGTEYLLATVINVGGFYPFITPVSGVALTADGHQIIFDVYMAGNIGASPRCTFGGTFTVK